MEALWPQDGKWYAAIITDVRDKTYIVKWEVDGSMLQLPRAHVRPTRTDQRPTPPQASSRPMALTVPPLNLRTLSVMSPPRHDVPNTVNRCMCVVGIGEGASGRKWIDDLDEG